MEGILDHIGPSGVVGAGFADAVKAELGVDYADTKYFDDATTLTGILKRGIDTRRSNTKLTEAAAHAIAKPGETATDQEKADFHKSLKAELGASANADDYNFAKPANWPEGLPFDEEGIKALQTYLFEKGYPVEDAKGLMAAMADGEIAKHTADEKVANDAYEAAAKVLTDKHSPAELTEMGQLVRKAIDGYGLPGKSPERNAEISQALAASPGDLAAWRQSGITPASYAWLAAVGKDMQAGTTKLGAGTVKTEDAQTAWVDKCSENSQSLQD